jgi:dethiobiotin synthetase
MKGYFITGTDTDCGKTRVACALIERFRKEGLRVAPFKPVAAGASRLHGRLCNDDALRLMQAAGGDWPYGLVNPYCFVEPVSPHIAAAEQGVKVKLSVIRDAANTLAADADLLLAEGAGGWRVPVAEDLDIQGLAVALGMPVILVVGLRLGCLNHARLSAEAIARSGLQFAGWIGSLRDPAMPRQSENLAWLKAVLAAPCLGVLPNLEADDSGAGYLSLPE